MLLLKSAVKRSVCVPMVMELATAGSTRPITSRVSHAGIVITTIYELTEPTIPPDPARREVTQGLSAP
jgi:hypothetical protein